MNDHRDERPDDALDELISQLAREHNEPPATPGDAIWARIETQRAAERGTGKRRWTSPWIWLPAAALFLLAMGIGIGRHTLRQDAERALAEQGQQQNREQVELLYRLAAVPVLSRSEILLTEYRGASTGAKRQVELGGWAGELLLETRLLLDSPAAADEEFKGLLEDLELFLAQIERNAVDGDPVEHELIKDGLRERTLLSRLRDRIPAGQATPGA
jgi:hypothetical protein